MSELVYGTLPGLFQKRASVAAEWALDDNFALRKMQARSMAPGEKLGG